MATLDRNDADLEPLWQAEQVAEYLGLHVQTVYAKAARGEIPSLKVGSRLRFRRSEVDAWLESTRPAEQGVA